MSATPQLESADAIRFASQLMEADRLLGVDFAPVSLHQPRIGDGIAVNASPEGPRAAAPQFNRAAEQKHFTGGDKAAALAALLARHDASCPHCSCVTGHTQTVFGEGNCNAELMYIGEAPGEEEDRTGRPFVGRAGQKLDEIIRAIGMRREDVYIANVLKARPPQNRTPLPHEVDACAPFLAEQIRIIQPKVIIALGGPASKWLLKTDVGITRLRGVFAWYEDGDLRIPVMPTFHPAYLLRNYTVETRKQVWSDMQTAMQRLNAG